MKNKKLLAIALITILALCCTACGGTKYEKKTINPAKYINITINGDENGNAWAEIGRIDYDGLSNAIGFDRMQDTAEKLAKKKKYQELECDYVETDFTARDLFRLVPDKEYYNHLKNGEVITITAEKLNPYYAEETNKAYYEALGIEIEDYQLTVSGLYEGPKDKSELPDDWLDQVEKIITDDVVYLTGGSMHYYENLEIKEVYLCDYEGQKAFVVYFETGLRSTLSGSTFNDQLKQVVVLPNLFLKENILESKNNHKVLLLIANDIAYESVGKHYSLYPSLDEIHKELDSGTTYTNAIKVY